MSVRAFPTDRACVPTGLSRAASQAEPLIANAINDTEYLVFKAEETLRALQDRRLEAGDVRTLERLVSRLKEETVQ